MTVYYPGVISDEEYRTFWISWKANEIAVGFGHKIGLDMLLAYYASDPERMNINAVAITSAKYSEASWRISGIEG